jgi:excisionase family DNA binding protein
MSDDQTISTGAAAKILHVTPRTVERWCNRGDLRSFRTAGGHRRIYVSSLGPFLGDMTQARAA